MLTDCIEKEDFQPGGSVFMMLLPASVHVASLISN